jgi:hypothetical protein
MCSVISKRLISLHRIAQSQGIGAKDERSCSTYCY